MEAKQLDQSKPMAKRTKTYHIPNEIPESELEECFLRIKSTFNDYGVSCTRDKRIITFLYTRRSLLPDIFGYRKRRTRNPAAINKASHLLRNYGPSLNEDGILKIPFSHFSDKKRVTKLQEAWPVVESALKKHGISCTLDLAEGSMTLSTTKSRDPDTIDVAWDHLELLSTTNVPASMLIKLLAGSMQYDLIKTGYQFGGIRSKFEINKEEWCQWERNLRHTLQGVALGVNCQVFITGNTITAVGTSPEGLKRIRNFVEDPFAKSPLRMD
ncbi:hypothetical protein M0R45_025100 [Rubus argutus]|uniref:KRR-R motif-containing protein 1 n=1 Tax=Rubus argutus TaxID=59490 RepID=A0AAW1WW44_RUBAR